jgi:hypothetical protein
VVDRHEEANVLVQTLVDGERHLALLRERVTESLFDQASSVWPVSSSFFTVHHVITAATMAGGAAMDSGGHRLTHPPVDGSIFEREYLASS